MEILIIGGGNLGCSLAHGFCISHFNSHIHLLYKGESTKFNDLKTRGCNLVTLENAEEIIIKCKVLIFCTPHSYEKNIFDTLHNIDKEYKKHYENLLENKILIFCQANFLGEIKTMASEKQIFHVVPNIGASCCKSVSCIEKNENHSQELLRTTINLFSQIGTVYLIRPEQMKAATLLCSSSVAFYSKIIRGLMETGIELGLDPTTALHLVNESMESTSNIIEVNKKHPEEVIDCVTTPKGLTITALNKMEGYGINAIFRKAIIETLNP
jgi:pyrroline-5-carboxylate reductase